MEQIIQDIQNRLEKRVPELKYVDQDWGQMDFWSRPPVKFPCVLIDIQSANYTNTGNFIQQGTITLVLRVYDMRLSNSSNGAPENQKQNAKKIWKLLLDINKALHAQNFLQTGYGLPIRTQMRRIKREDGCYQTELYYTIQLTDNSCEVMPDKVDAVPVIKLNTANHFPLV